MYNMRCLIHRIAVSADMSAFSWIPVSSAPACDANEEAAKGQTGLQSDKRTSKRLSLIRAYQRGHHQEKRISCLAQHES